MYVKGEGVPRDAAQAMAWLRKDAEQGDASAQFELGLMYVKGKVVPRDAAQAVAWFRKAAEQGDASAQRSLGVMYEAGDGVRSDAAQAVAWFRQAAEQGDVIAQLNLIRIYLNGEGVPRDAAQAAAWCRKAAEQGNAYAQSILGLMYLEGEVVPKDAGQALVWSRKAAEQGNALAQGNLGMIYVKGEGVPKDAAQAVAWFRKAAEQGVASAQYNLGVMYVNGEGIPKDVARAAAWFRKAAEQGNASAQYNLGLMYLKGEGVPRDERSAYFWWLLASAGGNQGAVGDRDIVERRMLPQQRAAAQEDARNWKPKTASESNNPTGEDTGLGSASGRQVPVSPQADSTGSGFRVAPGDIVTNHHVIDGCSRLRVNGVAAQLRGSDARNDLALVNVNLGGTSASLRTQRAAVGEPVAVAGYPLSGLLSGFNMTTGILSSLSGAGGDTRLLQITAPVQLGNSGGPALDSAGNLLGVVVSKLDAIKTAKITGDIPQNVNFAINSNVLRSFLDANSVPYEMASSDKTMPTTAIAGKAKGFTVLVECWK